eukprot:gene3633-14870_t
MEGLAEIYRSQSLQSTNMSEKSASTLSLKKIFGKKHPKDGSKYSFLGSQAESVNSCSTTASSKSTDSQQSNASNASVKSTDSTASKSSKWRYSTERFSGSKSKAKKPSMTKEEYFKSKNYHEAVWSQAYLFGGR